MPRGEGIKKLGSLFDKYTKTLRAPERSVTTTTAEVVGDLLGISLKPEQFAYKPNSRTLTVVGAAPLRSEILLHKEEILLHIKGRLGEQNTPTDII